MKTIDKSWLFFCGVFATVGVVCLVLAYFNYASIKNQIKDGTETEGTVIGHYKQKQLKPTTALAVVVAYKDQYGKPLVYYSTTYTTPVEFQIGEQVKLWYNPKQHNEIIIKGKNMGLIPMILAGFGIVFSLIGLPGFLKELFKLIL